MKHLITAVILLFSFQAHASDWQESVAVGTLFEQAGVTGTFVLYDVTAGLLTGHDKARAEKRFVPASTFKIANALIGLSTGAVNNVDEVLSYGGRPQPFKTWEKDMGLREAVKLSNVAIFQELARRIGLERMRDNVSRMDFGNKAIGSAVDSFWLAGPLEITAVEQSRFLAKLAQGQLPFPEVVQASVREIVLLEQGAGWRLYGKTGWENAPGRGVGWWVGWVEKQDRVYGFALNMDMRNAADAGKRVELGRGALKALGVF
ncbi:class D beta-lactamase [Methylomonas sp. UP202]|uniref:class D beta-lactamase n=1 Tax=Methylomonas sp. UP202 TaxID=3040943 RepID=UPI00247A6130|nr:class D beta-lactamase [Methylomonas sp. UP202]WGS84034.1 class D beta-lactamase [Methylomonas sp. UP202]